MEPIINYSFRPIKRIPTIPNEHFPQNQSVLCLNSFPGCMSASRKQMYANNLGQLVVFKGLTEKYIQTGAERKNYAKTTFSVRMPQNGKITAVIPRYREKEGIDVIKHNPQTVVIYEGDNAEYGMINLSEYSSYHPYLGFTYVKSPDYFNLVEGKYIKKDTIFQDSPGVTKDGDYMYGRECNVAFMTLPGVAEDGIIVNRDVLEHFAYPTYETRIVEYGSKDFPLNLYCKKDENGYPLEYKAHPEIGDYIREDGILMAIRTYDERLAIVEQSVSATMEPDFLFDRLIYAGGPGGDVVTHKNKIIGRTGKIIDIRVHHDSLTTKSNLPPTMEEQTLKYNAGRMEFYKSLYDLNIMLHRRHGQNLVLSKELHRLMVEAISVVAPGDMRVQKVNKRVPLDEWRIEFVIEYLTIPDLGKKVTDEYGGKGVFCSIREPEQMPRDADGNVADLIFDPSSSINRMIIARLYEPYFNSASRDVLKKIIKQLGVTQKQNKSKIAAELTAIEKTNPELINSVWQYLLGYYKIVVPKQFEIYEKGMYQSTPISHLAHIIHAGHFVLQIRSDHELEFKNMVADVEEFYPPLHGPVTYINEKGRLITTKNPVRIAPMHILMLEKLADTWAAVSSARLQHYGVLATLSTADKYAQPGRPQPTKCYGEAEIRIVASYAGARTAAEIMDRNNSSVTHKEMVYNIYNSDNPSNIDNAVDRNKIPLGGSKPLSIVKHIFACGGIGFEYTPYASKYEFYQPGVVKMKDEHVTNN